MHDRFVVFLICATFCVLVYHALKINQFVRIEKKINEKMLAIEEMVNIQQEILQELMQDLRMRMH